MPCEEYKDALVEAAAAGAEPRGELRAHLQTCAACQAALAEEQALFLAIDDGLHVAANAEVPASLFPRVRASLDMELEARPFWSPKWYVLAGAAAMLAALFIAQTLQRPRVEPKPVESANDRKTSRPHVQPQKDQFSSIAAPVNGRPVAQRPSVGGSGAPRESAAHRETTPEILVPGDQEVLLARYAEEWSRRKRGRFVVANESNDNGLKPLEVAPIQIAELDVKPLTEAQSQ